MLPQAALEAKVQTFVLFLPIKQLILRQLWVAQKTCRKILLSLNQENKQDFYAPVLAMF